MDRNANNAVKVVSNEVDFSNKLYSLISKIFSKGKLGEDMKCKVFPVMF